MDASSGEAQKILAWVRAEGDAAAFSRVRLKMLPDSVREGVSLEDLDDGVSDAYLARLREVSEKVVGKDCPH